MIALLVPMLCVDVFAANHPVNDFAELKKAIANAQDGDVITVNVDITITETLMITKNITIKSDGTKTLKAGPLKMDSIEGCNMFYVPDGKTLSLENITLDGANEARLIRAKGAKLNLTNVIMKNGSTGKVEKNSQTDQVYSGGAIYAEAGSIVTIKGGSFENNNTGTKKLDGTRAAEGGAIKIDSSVITITGTKFEGNHLDDWNTEGGRQGGAIEATNTKAVINNATFNIPGPFNTGGAIKFENCKDAKVTGSTFTIDENKGQFGVAGGAITSQNSNLTIEKSNFKAGSGTRVQEAGGLIQVVGTGTFNLIDSELEGAGASWNAGKYTANTGGAISFYDDSTVTAKIENTTIKNFMADGNGAGIALSKGNGHSSSVNLTLKNTTIQNAAAYTWDANSYGGCMYIGEGNTVKIDGGTISGQTTSNIAAGIYNMGNLEITGGARITGNTAYQMVGGIYHGGNRLKIDDATISGNQKGDNSTGHNHFIDGKEKSGINIYADKDVIITPKATFDGNDVRVFDGQSSILLTGKLTNKINVSISEDKKTTKSTNANIKVFEEDKHRKVGYVVAKGTENYEATAEDAKKLHYVTNDTTQEVAGADDHTSPGKWDYVLNPEDKTIVLGQRVKLVYHGNTGKIGTEEKKEKTVDVYKVGNFWEKQLDKYKVVDPEKAKNEFMGWYFWESGDSAGDTDTSVQDIKKPENFKDNLFDFSNVDFSSKDKEEIVDIITPNVINTYAGWSKNIDLEVAKKWVDAEESDKKDISVTLYDGENQVGKAKKFAKADNYGGKFENLPVFTKSYEPSEKINMNLKFTPKEYKVKEENLEGFTTSYEPETITANSDDAKKIKITNKKAKTGNVYVKYIAEDGTVLEAESVVISNAAVGTDYTTTQKTFDEYEFLAMGQGSAAASGKVVAGDLHVVYVYKKTEPTPEPTSDFTITKTVDKAYYEKAGDILTYTITVTNTGNTDLKGLKLSDSLVNVKDEPFNLDKGASQEFKYTYTISEDDVKLKSVTNVASVTLGKDSKEAKATSILKEKEKRGDVYVRYETEDGKILDEFAVLIDAPIGTPYYTEEKAFPRYRFVGLAPYSDPAEGYVVEGTQYVVYLYRRDRGGRTPDRRRDRYEREEEKVEEPIVEAKRKPELNKKDHKQYMYGYPDWTFVPAANITRGEAAAMFARLFKEYPGLDYNYKKYYTDVDESYWGFKEVAYLSEFGILSGYSDGTFRPNNKITRAEFVKIAESFEALTWGLSPYNDVDGGHWAFRYIVSSAAKGWISGYPDGSFRPNSFISRAEAVTIVNRLLERRPDKDYIDTHKPELKPFTDLKPSYWAYYEIYEAVDGHDYNRSFTDIEEHWYRLNNERFVFSQPRYYR